MKPATLLPAALFAAFALAACDNTKAPGKDPIYKENLDAVPPANATVTDLDSVNRQQTVTTPQGAGSAADISQSTDAQLNSAPAGGAATTPTTVSGGMDQPSASVNGQNKNGTQAPSKASPTTAPPNGNPPISTMPKNQ